MIFYPHTISSNRRFDKAIPLQKNDPEYVRVSQACLVSDPTFSLISFLTQRL